MLHKKLRAFTLIELLVVIAIIAILAAILFPVFARAREKARQIACTSNAKQFMLGILQYAQDSDEAMPVAYSVPHSIGALGAQLVGNGCAPTGVPAEIMPYIKSTEVFHCPDDSGNMVINGDVKSTGQNCYSPTGAKLGTLSTTQVAGHNYAQILGTSYKFTHQNFSNPYVNNDAITGYSQPGPGNPDSETDYPGNPSVVLNTAPAYNVTTWSNGTPVSGFGTVTLAAFARPAETRVYADFPKNFSDVPIKAPKIAFHPIGTTIAYVDGHVKFVIRYSQYASGCDGVDWAWDVPGSCNSMGIQRAAD